MRASVDAFDQLMRYLRRRHLVAEAASFGEEDFGFLDKIFTAYDCLSHLDTIGADRDDLIAKRARHVLNGLESAQTSARLIVYHDDKVVRFDSRIVDSIGHEFLCLLAHQM